VHKIIFYPVQNGDTSQIILSNGKRLLFDFRHLRHGEDEEEPVIDLKTRLKDELDAAGRDYFDVVAFTHADKDHISNSTEFFELQHAGKYRGDGRIKIRELWVPAAMILEDGTREEQSSEFVLWRQEARDRLKKGRGIRVFSKPEMLKQWLLDNGLTLDSRRHLITDAGQLVPGFSLPSDGVEFFCHSPFVKHVDGGDDLRNGAALIFQVRFQVGVINTDYLAVGDSTWEVLHDIVYTTMQHGNEERLKWDLFNIPHHCSYKALGSEKGNLMTDAAPLVAQLLLHGQKGAYLVSSSKPIDVTPEAYTQVQPPHVQAKKCYEQYLKVVGGRKFLVTMEEPSISKPEPLEFQITSGGLHLNPYRNSGVGIIVSSPAPRAG
jgi:hypothetical protein